MDYANLGLQLGAFSTLSAIQRSCKVDTFCIGLETTAPKPLPPCSPPLCPIVPPSLPKSKVKPDMYVAYEAHPSDDTNLGLQLGAFPTLSAAQRSCKDDTFCIGLKFVRSDAANPWRTFKGSLMEGVTGKVRVLGENINPWVVEDSAN